jgi:hypothetical protein
LKEIVEDENQIKDFLEINETKIKSFFTELWEKHLYNPVETTPQPETIDVRQTETAQPEMPKEPLSALAETVLKDFESLSARAETAFKDFEPLSARAETVFKDFEPLSARAEAVLKDFEPVSDIQEDATQKKIC